MLGLYIGIISLLCVLLVASILLICYIYSSKVEPPIWWTVVYCICFTGLIVACGLYFAGITPMYHYEVTDINNETLTELKEINICRTFACYGDCFSSFPVGLSCIVNPFSSNNHPMCTSYCYEYYKKYAAIKSYNLVNLDDKDKSITESI
jgi:hypothetical protein